MSLSAGGGAAAPRGGEPADSRAPEASHLARASFGEAAPPSGEADRRRDLISLGKKPAGHPPRDLQTGSAAFAARRPPNLASRRREDVGGRSLGRAGTYELGAMKAWPSRRRTTIRLHRGHVHHHAPISRTTPTGPQQRAILGCGSTFRRRLLQHRPPHAPDLHAALWSLISVVEALRSRQTPPVVSPSPPSTWKPQHRQRGGSFEPAAPSGCRRSFFGRACGLPCASCTHVSRPKGLSHSAPTAFTAARSGRALVIFVCIFVAT